MALVHCDSIPEPNNHVFEVTTKGKPVYWLSNIYIDMLILSGERGIAISKIAPANLEPIFSYLSLPSPRSFSNPQ